MVNLPDTNWSSPMNAKLRTGLQISPELSATAMSSETLFVKPSGARTAARVAIFSDTVSTLYNGRCGITREWAFSSLPGTSALTAPGDSGGCILSADGRVAALVWGGDYFVDRAVDLTYGTPAKYLLEEVREKLQWKEINLLPYPTAQDYVNFKILVHAEFFDPFPGGQVPPRPLIPSPADYCCTKIGPQILQNTISQKLASKESLISVAADLLGLARFPDYYPNAPEVAFWYMLYWTWQHYWPGLSICQFPGDKPPPLPPLQLPEPALPPLLPSHLLLVNRLLLLFLPPHPQSRTVRVGKLSRDKDTRQERGLDWQRRFKNN
ncbi:hypothetical protein DL98DRAFT_537118 [Cadophora sp. DSE1049]|nr:hypothetical protein DL98DRAFT_537118 [Cadophora sp. DSE1049]